MRIIAGIYKNRNIPSIKKADYRPSTAKFREALFSILSSGEFQEKSPVIDANILDLFSGTGALSFEALSRGGTSVTLIDLNKENLEIAKEFAAKLNRDEDVEIIAMDATRLLKANREHDLIFLDPPYYKNYIGKTLSRLMEYGWMSDGAIIAIEMAKEEEFKIHNCLELLKEKIYGKTKLLILKYFKHEKEQTIL